MTTNTHEYDCAVARRGRERERHAKGRSTGRRGSRHFTITIIYLWLCRRANPSILHKNEQPDCTVRLSDQTVRSHQSGDLGSGPSRSLLRSSATWICASPVGSSSRAHNFTATATVMANRPAGSSLPVAPTYHELSSNWRSLSTRSLIVGPITRNRARRPVARDSNDGSPR